MFEQQIIVDQKNRTIKAGECVNFTFPVSLEQKELERNRFRMQLRGAVGFEKGWICETGMTYLFRDIDDSLSQETHHSRFALKLVTEGEDYPRRAYYKVTCPPRINAQYAVPESDDTQWKFHGFVKTENFHVQEGGSAEVRFEIYLKKEGRDIRDISGEADKIVTVPLPEGTADWSEINGIVPITADTASVLVTVETRMTTGTIWMEDFSLRNDTGYNILPTFDLTNRYHPNFNWFGENLSRKEWTDMEITINGQKLKKQSLFQRCFAGSENEVELPEGILKSGENEITLKNISDYLCPEPYTLSRMALIMTKKHPVQVIYSPEYVKKNQEFALLLETIEPNTTVAVKAVDFEPSVQKLELAEAGLHVVTLTAGESGVSLPITVSSGAYEETVTIKRIVDKVNEDVLVGSGDAVYIPQEKEEMERFLCWYLSGHLGNMLTFRPVYRWCGSRMLRPETWKRVAKLCNDLKLYYCYISDGREMPGIAANPTDELMQGEYYLGSQGHERDGCENYWRQRDKMVNDCLYEELIRKVRNHPDYDYHTPITYDGENIYYNFSPVHAKNMAEASAQFIKNIKTLMGSIKRHTGPTALFKYFYQAGVEVCGAEVMYGPQEMLLASLRGAADAYDKKDFSAHLAVQWGTTPHESISHYRRFALALMVSYMQGCTQINTEEGLYRMEEFFSEYDRFSPACTEHAKVQQQFLRYVQTHTRRGKMVNPVAFLHGENDGWQGFCRSEVWGQHGKQWEFGIPEESWDVAKVFYPDSNVDAIYCHPCPDSPQGYYTRLPYGTTDILPVEASLEKYGKHSHLAFLGFNTADESQVEKLVSYVENGGKLLLGWCHLLPTADRVEALHGNMLPIEADALTGVHIDRFHEKNGVTVGELTIVSEAVTVLKETDGQPLLLKHELGKGCVYLVNAREFPIIDSVKGCYEEILHLFGRESVAQESKKGWMPGIDTVETAVYDREDGHRVIYAVNTDWWSKEEPDTRAELLLGDLSYPVEIPRNRITQVTINKNFAAITSDLETEIMAITSDSEGFTLTVQGCGKADIIICSPKELKTFEGMRKAESDSAQGNQYHLTVELAGKQEIRIL